MKINSLERLKLEKLQAKANAKAKLKVLENDVELIKKELAPLSIFNKAASLVVPEQLRRSNLINAPINFIARTLFHEKHDVVHPGNDAGKGNQVRNVALSVIETAATYLLTKYIRRKF
jgi:hypothetical protein